MNWIGLTSFYGVAAGVRNLLKKEALKKSPLLEVLFLYTLSSFIFIAPVSLIPDPGAMLLDNGIYYFYLLLKSFVIFIAWILAFKAMSKLPISLFGVLETSRVIFATILGVFLVNETMSKNRYAGLFLVMAGLILVNIRGKNKESRKASFAPIVCVITASILNSISGTMDKLLLRTGELNSAQLQFWFMLFTSLLYFIYVLITKTKIHLSTIIKNPCIIIMGILLLLGDRALFMANESKDSLVTVMILLQQLSLVVTIILGKIFFREKHIIYRLFCAALVISGIVISTL